MDQIMSHLCNILCVYDHDDNKFWHKMTICFCVDKPVQDATRNGNVGVDRDCKLIQQPIHTHTP